MTGGGGDNVKERKTNSFKLSKNQIIVNNKISITASNGQGGFQ